MRAILSAKVVWAAAKDAEVAEKVRTASMIARKSRGDIEICCMGGVEVLNPIMSEETRGTRGAEEAGEACSGVVTTSGMDTGIWGSSARTVGGG